MKFMFLFDEVGSTFRVVENAAAVKCHFKDVESSMKLPARVSAFSAFTDH